MASRRAIVLLAVLVIVVGSTADARAGSGPDGVDTSGDVPAVPTTDTDTDTDTESGDPPTGTEGGSPTGGGVVSGAGTVEKEVAVAPVIHCLWLTSDMDPEAPGIQREHQGLADDLPDVPTPTPCGADPQSGAPVTVPTNDALAHVRPWSADDPGHRLVEIWMIVSHAAGPESITGPEVRLEGLDLGLADEADTTDIDTAVRAGVTSGQLTSTAAVDLEQLVIEGWGVAVRSALQLTYLDGCGELTVIGSATAGGETSTVTAPVEVPCYHRLLADFDEIAWGSLVRGAETVVSGDHDRSTGDRPTLFNAGNTPIVLATTFAPLCSIGDPTQCMGEFGVEVSGTDGVVHRNDPAPPGEELLSPDPIVCPGGVVRLDVLVSTPDAVASGEYVGSMDMVGRSADGDCAEPTARTEPTTPSSAPPSSAPPSSAPPSSAPPGTGETRAEGATTTGPIDG